MSTIDDLERKVHSLKDQLYEAEKKLHQAKLDACPIKIGAIVCDRQGKEYRVAAVDVRYGCLEKPWVIGNPKRADGTFGTGRRNLFKRYQVKTSS